MKENTVIEAVKKIIEINENVLALNAKMAETLKEYLELMKEEK